MAAAAGLPSGSVAAQAWLVWICLPVSPCSFGPPKLVLAGKKIHIGVLIFLVPSETGQVES